jgi:translation initiation factor IF-2
MDRKSKDQKSKIENPPRQNSGQATSTFAPVISVLGHVDHGKTSLLDKIRTSTVAEREHGGITQKIGASEIEIQHEGKVRKITFIDTPGHEAFAKMRSQGVNAADIVLLVIAADDGIKPQTKESIIKILESKTPYIVVFTKIDREEANVEKIKQQVVKDGILLESLGGNVPFIGVSSKTGEGIKELLDLIILVYDLSGIQKKSTGDFMGVVIDAKQDKRRGIIATVVVKSGKIAVGDQIYTHGRQVGKVRAITNASLKNIREAVSGDAVEVLGITEALPAGSVLFDKEVELVVVQDIKPIPQAPEDIMQFLRDVEADIVPIIIKTESSAELEALRDSLPSKVKVIYEGQGEISASDVLMAKDFHALVLGFNVGINREAETIAQNEKVFYKSYNIIYQLFEELEDLILTLGKKDVERELGKGEVVASFLGSSGPIIGLKVAEGRLAVGDRIRIMRAEREVGVSKIMSIKHGKEDAKIANKNTECGIMIAPEVDFAPQDVIIAYSKG